VKIAILDLEFSTKRFYIQNSSIVEKITFNNRTFYSKFQEIKTKLTPALLQQHLKDEITLALPLIEENDLVRYIVIEYHQEDWSQFYSLLKYLLKTLNINNYKCYFNNKKMLFQLFIPRDNISLERAYIEVENIKHHLELKSKKSYKIYPNRFLPKNYNIITLPTKKL